MIAQLLMAAALAAAGPSIPGPLAAPFVQSVPAPALTSAQTAFLRQALDRAAEHGFADGVFVPVDLDRQLESTDPATRQAGEGVLVRTAARYGLAVRNGLLASGQFPADWAQRPAPYDAAADLARALAADRLAAWLDDLPPPTPAYAQLQVLLGRYDALAAAGGWPQVAAGKLLALGVEDDRVATLRRRLAVEDPAAETGESRLFDEPLAQAVAAFQTRHGLSPTGKVDRKTLAELNITAETRVDQIRANLERRRWAARTAPPTRIEVNVAAQTLDYFQGGVPVLSMRTIVGRPADRTPLFSDMVETIVFNPPWNVPSTIAAKEIWPKERRSPGYLARNDFVVLPGPTLQQRPGPKSALGRYKFDLPNRFDVYLHDTPNHALFSLDERALSHGCIRLDRPADLARLVLEGDPQWTPQAVQAALDQGVTVRALLSRPVPVSIAYWTVFVDAQGQANFRRDLYGWDVKLLRLREGRAPG